MPPSSNPESSASFPIPQHTSHFWRSVFVNEIEHDDAVWKEYLEAAQIVDSRMLSEWNGFLDVILVFIGLFIATLTSFAIETQKLFDPDQAKITNELLGHILNTLSNSSSVPIEDELDKVTKLGLNGDPTAVTLNALLFVSLALAIVIAMGAMAAKLWLIRYISWVRSPGSPYDRAMNRQEAFGGLESWKFQRVINTLPLFTLVAVFFFGVFIYLSICGHNRKLGFIIGKILGLGLVFLLVASCSAAFIPSSPFQSPFSRLITYFFNLIPTRGRTIVVSFVSTAMAIAATLLGAYRSPAWQILMFFPIAGTFAVARTPKKSNNYSPLHGPPGLVLVGGITVYIMMDVAAAFQRSPIIYISVSSVGFVVLGFLAYQMNRLTRFVPNTLEAEAIAWLLESSSSQQPELFKKAGCIASTTQCKVTLLNTLHRFLPPLIASRLRYRPGEAGNNELKLFLACLAQASDFPDSGMSLLHNRAAIKHPALPRDLREQLKELRESNDMSLRDAAEAVWCHYPSIEDEKQVYQQEDEA